jgi:hypothetical protein
MLLLVFLLRPPRHRQRGKGRMIHVLGLVVVPRTVVFLAGGIAVTAQ